MSHEDVINYNDEMLFYEGSSSIAGLWSNKALEPATADSKKHFSPRLRIREALQPATADSRDSALRRRRGILPSTA